jgi:hypothetical protein
MTPQERQHINALLEAASISGASLEAAVRSICQEMLYLTAAEVAEACRAHAEELHLNAAVSSSTRAGPTGFLRSALIR